jgi:hypothetical protein
VRGHGQKARPAPSPPSTSPPGPVLLPGPAPPVHPVRPPRLLLPALLLPALLLPALAVPALLLPALLLPLAQRLA